MAKNCIKVLLEIKRRKCNLYAIIIIAKSISWQLRFCCIEQNVEIVKIDFPTQLA